MGCKNTSGLFLAYEAREPTRYGICKTPVAAGNGGGQVGYDIEPDIPINLYFGKDYGRGILQSGCLSSVVALRINLRWI